MEMMQLNQIPIQIIPQVKMLYNPQSKSAYNFVPGVIGLIMMIICAMMTSISIVREKENGTMEVLLASPVKPLHIILAKAVPYFTLSIINLFSILLLSSFMFDVPIAGSFSWLLIVSIIFIIVALSLGLLISSVVKTQVLAVLFSGMGLMMPTIAMSGMVFPIDSMPPLLQWISCLVPARWFIAAIRKLMIQGVEVKFVLKELAILTFMALFLLTISLRKFKKRLE
jgi:ABC-2 type transport system permease protein